MTATEILERLAQRRALGSGGIEDRLHDLEWALEQLLEAMAMEELRE